MNKMQRILLIGGSGFIGLYVAKRLSELSHTVTIFGRSSNGLEKLEFANKVHFIKGDVTDYKAIAATIKNKDAIVNLAAVISNFGKFDPFVDLAVNCKGQLNILEARRKVNPDARYIFMGSRTQFGQVEKETLPVPEDDCQRPISLYGIHKQTAENYCGLYKRAYDLESIILRLSLVYGPGLTEVNSSGIINKIIVLAMKDEQFKVNGYGQDLKDVIYVGDVVDLIVKILESDVKAGTFNVGAGDKIKLIEIAEKVVRLCKSGSYEAVPFPDELMNFELGSFYFDISKAKKTFDWEPKTNIQDGLRNTIASYKHTNKT